MQRVYECGNVPRKGDTVIRTQAPRGAWGIGYYPTEEGFTAEVHNLYGGTLGFNGFIGQADPRMFKLIARAWKENTGTRPDLPDGTRIDIEYRDGGILYNAPFDKPTNRGGDQFSWREDEKGFRYHVYWGLGTNRADIVRYRVRTLRDDGAPCTDKAVPLDVKPEEPKAKELKVLL